MSRVEEMPRALLVAHHYPPHIGGLGIVVWQQAQSMAERGFQVVILTSKYGARSKKARFDGPVEVLRVPCWHVMENVFSIVFPLFSPSLVYQMWRQVKRADIVHIHDVFYMTSWVAAIFAFFAHRPILLTQHVAMVDHPNKLVMLVQKMVYATIGRWIFSKARRIVVYNKNVHFFLRSQGVPEARILLMANGINTTEFCPATSDERWAIRNRFGLPQDRRLVLFVGRLVAKKGYQILLEARDPDYELVFVGPGPIMQIEQSAGVRWLGPLDQADTRELYRACDLFAFPAIGEIFTLVIQEAMACGLPVLTTNDPAYAASLESQSMVLCSRDAGSFKNAIKKLLSQADVLSALGVRSRQLAVQNFDWRANMSRLLDAYSDTLRPKA